MGWMPQVHLQWCGEGTRGRVTLQQWCLVLQPQKRAQAWAGSHLPVIRGTSPCTVPPGDPTVSCGPWWPIGTWQQCSRTLLGHLCLVPEVSQARKLPHQRKSRPRLPQRWCFMQITPQSISNCLITPSRASRVSHPKHRPGSVQPGGSAAVVTWEQQSHTKEFISKAEPFLCSKSTCGQVNKTIYREVPWTSNAGQLLHAGKALKTLK